MKTSGLVKSLSGLCLSFSALDSLVTLDPCNITNPFQVGYLFCQLIMPDAASNHFKPSSFSNLSIHK